MYISEGDNTGTIELAYYIGRQEYVASYTKENEGEILKVEAFKIKNLTDELDPYSLVTVKFGTQTNYYVANQEMNDVWSVPGIYTVSVINRLGYSYSIQIEVMESDYATISFTGEKTDNIQSILTCKGERNIELPEIQRIGYELVGFDDGEGELYCEEISVVQFTGEKQLKAVWKPKTFTVTMVDGEGNVLEEKETRFGETCDLGTLKVDSSQEFIGWMHDGKILKDNIYKFDKEGNIVVQAVIKNLFIESEDNTEEQNNAEFPWGLLLSILVAIIGGVAFVKLYKGKKAIDFIEKIKERGVGKC